MGLNVGTIDINNETDFLDVFEKVAEQLICEHASLVSSDTDVTKSWLHTPLTTTSSPLNIVTASTLKSQARIVRILREISVAEDSGEVFV